MNNKKKSKRKIYNHCLRDFVRITGDVSFAINIGVLGSTARSWRSAPAREVISEEFFDLDDMKVRARILKLERKVKLLTAIIGLLLALIQISDLRISGKHNTIWQKQRSHSSSNRTNAWCDGTSICIENYRSEYHQISQLDSSESQWL